MTPLLASIAAAVAGGIATDVARDRLRYVVERYRRPLRLGGPRFEPPPPRQTAEPRQVLTPPVSVIPVGRPFETPVSGPMLAGRLARWR